ncbi:hypothetical protein [Metamycoplasma equirhinis]|uniref:DUF4231 domain-containing protein n=1 Tax=Metamycoplasma equirhinis TaxID=92402 RepID=A0ABZ0PB32_9BACT|nr:hypothetical protein [Metamycoplasma equirhinis]TPD98238.1 hypothetical protein FJM08_02000 [Metamycoplasma equirhinis]WPB54075.1 hypothetical protein R9B83_00665 [Metamycoplasma equirhinis]BDX52516.1 hypothetical protein JPM7_1230 [Metamycoplasma equirhinis]
MNNRKLELKKLKTLEVHSIWYWALITTIIALAWLLTVYISVVFQNKYETRLQTANDVVISCFVGLLSAAILILASFIFLDLFKRSRIHDYFEYYAYLNSLRTQQKHFIFKEKRIAKIFDLKEAMTKTQFIAFVAKLLNYSTSSIEYGNLVNEINTDFAKHSFLEPNYRRQKRKAIFRSIFFNILLPLAINAIIIFAIVQFLNQDEQLSAIIRFLIIIMVASTGVGFSIFIYEIYILSSVKNYESFNNFYLLSFNNYDYKYLNSSLIKK